MTRRALIVLLVGVVLAAVAAGSFAHAGRSGFTPSKPLPGWGVFTPAQWKTVSLRIERRGFDAETIRLVGATDTTHRQPFGLVAGRSRMGTTCVMPVKGTTVGPTVCRLAKPLVVFTAPETWTVPAFAGKPAHVVHATAVLGIARDDVAGVVVKDPQLRPSGIALVRSGRMLTFAAGLRHLTSLRAFDAKNRTLARVVPRAP